MRYGYGDEATWGESVYPGDPRYVGPDSTSLTVNVTVKDTLAGTEQKTTAEVVYFEYSDYVEIESITVYTDDEYLEDCVRYGLEEEFFGTETEYEFVI